MVEICFGLDLPQASFNLQGTEIDSIFIPKEDMKRIIYYKSVTK